MHATILGSHLKLRKLQFTSVAIFCQGQNKDLATHPGVHCPQGYKTCYAKRN